MNYKDRVYQYFQFSSSMTINIGRKNKEEIRISGKPSGKTVVFYLIFCACFIFIGCMSAFVKDNIYMIIATIVVALTSLVCVYIKSKSVFDKIEPKTTNINIYQRELPSKLKPAHVRMLLKDGLIDGTSVAATLLDLIDRDYLKIINQNDNQISKLNIWDKSDMILRRTDKDTSDLLKFEKFLINWFIDICGDKKQVLNKELHRKLCDVNNSTTSSELFQQFQAYTVLSFPLNKYYDKNKINNIIYVTFIFLGFFPFVPFINVFLSIYGLGCALFASPMYVMNQEGVDEKDEWKDLRNYLVDFSDMKNKNAEMVELWEFYLTYSIALDISSIASKEIKDFFGDNIYISNRKVNEENRINNYSNMNFNSLSSITEQIEKEVSSIEQEIKEEQEKYQL